MSGTKTGFVIGCVLLVLTVVVTGSFSAEIPRRINYQGKLTDGATGSPLPGSHDIDFGIYDDPGAGTLLWSESQTVSADSAGVFFAILGSVTPIDVSFDSPVWLEVEVDGEALWPRREMVSVPFSFRASEADHTERADSLGGFAAGDFVRQGETSVITSEMIVDGTGSGLDADMVDSLNADAFADTGHTHDDRYYTQDQLNTPGLINESSNPLEWTRLKNVPGGFADGTDDAGGTGDGHSLDAADGDPVDAVYVADDGNVGVGTASPSSKLDIAGSLNLADVLKVGGSTVLSATTNNAFFGIETGNSGTSNTFVGAEAGHQNTSGGDNTFIGRGAGASNTSAWQNTFVGANAGMGNVTGSNSVFVGKSAGASNSAGHENTFVGCFAGIMNSGSSDNTFIGARSGQSNTSGHSNTYLGKEAGYMDSTGTGNTFVGKSAGMWTTTGSGNLFLGYEAGYEEMGSNKLYIANGRDPEDVLIHGDFATGRIGLGTLAPERKLHVMGDGPRVLIEASSANPEVNFKLAGDPSSEVWAIYKHSISEDLRFYQNGDRVVMKSGTGRLGVGIADPTGQVQAEAADVVALLGRSQNQDGVVGWTGASGKSGVYGWSSTGAGVSGRSEAASGRGVDGVATSTGGVGVYGRSTYGFGIVAESDNSHAIHVLNSGWNGIDIMNAGESGVKVHTAGHDGVRVTRAAWSGVYVDSAGYGGLRIRAAGQDGIRIFNSIGRDYIRAGSDADADFKVTNRGAAYADSGWYGPADFSEIMRVEGNIETYEPGDVLVISTAADRSVERSLEPRSTLVTGVYSASPGFIGSPHVMEGKGDDEIPVAVVGIVPCKASAENGPIGRGDLLVTSSTPGHAMRAGKADPGTIIGKALEPLASGTGVIEILVTLQ
jgi:hypothetical protein